MLALRQIEDIKLFAATCDEFAPNSIAAPAVSFHQCIQSCFIEAARLVACTRISKFTGKNSERTDPAARHIADWFCNQNLFFRGCDHAVNHVRRIRPEMVEARLNYNVFSARQRSVFLEVPDDTGGAASANPVDKMLVDIEANIAHALCPEITVKQRARSAADIRYRGAFSN